MSLSTKAIDRLFERMAATYLSQWTRQFEHVPLADAKTAWAHELSVFAGRLEVFAWALENLPPKVPNLIEFKQLCRQAPRPPEQQLPAPRPDPERLAVELAKLADVQKAAKDSAHLVDPKGWAKALKARDESGEKPNPTVRRFYREALKSHLEPLEA
jgi:hypothetical protein